MAGKNRAVELDSWLQAYVQWASINESPELFHLWVGATIISAVLNRDVKCSLLFNLYPNLYTVLVAGSQKCRKSTSIEFGMKILEQIDSPPTLFRQKMTPQALIAGLKDSAEESEKVMGVPKATGMVVADELSTYLDDNSIRLGMIPVLLKLHDCEDPFEYRTMERGVESLPKSYLTLLAGTAPEYLKTSMPIEQAGGGILARTLLVYQDTPSKARPYMVQSEEREEQEKKLVRDLNRISRLQGDMDIDSEGYDWYDDWYRNKWHSDKKPLSQDPSLKHYYNKKPDHLGTLAIILSLAESDKLVIKKKHFQRGLKVLGKTEELMHKAVAEITKSGMGTIIQTTKEVILQLHSHGEKPSMQNILRIMHQEAEVEQVRRALDTLGEAGMVKAERKEGTVCYIPVDLRERPK